MRISINDQIIEIAKKHSNTKERIEIYGKALLYYIEGMLIDERMEEYLSKQKRISEKMKGNKNRSATTEKTDVAELKNRCGRTEKPSKKPRKREPTDDALTIYITNNNRLYLIVCKYIENNKQYGSISYQINKQGKEKYIYSQMKEAEKLVKEIGFKNLNDILEFISKDDFRSKQILSIAKLNRKNKDGVPYHVVIMDKMRPQKLLQQRQQKEIELHRQRIAEQIQSFKSEINENEQTRDQKGDYNRRQNISFS